MNYPWNSGVLERHYTDFDSGDTILLVCRSGNRTQSAAGFLDGKGYTDVYNMTGGMIEWTYEMSSVCHDPIPTLGEWGFMLAALLLAASGVLFGRRHHCKIRAR